MMDLLVNRRGERLVTILVIALGAVFTAACGDDTGGNERAESNASSSEYAELLGSRIAPLQWQRASGGRGYTVSADIRAGGESDLKIDLYDDGEQVISTLKANVVEDNENFDVSCSVLRGDTEAVIYDFVLVADQVEVRESNEYSGDNPFQITGAGCVSTEKFHMTTTLMPQDGTTVEMWVEEQAF